MIIVGFALSGLILQSSIRRQSTTFSSTYVQTTSPEPVLLNQTHLSSYGNFSVGDYCLNMSDLKNFYITGIIARVFRSGNITFSETYVEVKYSDGKTNTVPAKTLRTSCRKLETITSTYIPSENVRTIHPLIVLTNRSEGIPFSIIVKGEKYTERGFSSDGVFLTRFPYVPEENLTLTFETRYKIYVINTKAFELIILKVEDLEMGG
ncbi:MAG: hypothetical protein QXP04_02845 [Candidatus Nanoarchaeia archaeon]|nr:hypothetical protein [Candidatus Jingweiarchaeum tengchongense]